MPVVSIGLRQGFLGLRQGFLGVKNGSLSDSLGPRRRLQNVSKTPVEMRGLGRMPEKNIVETSGWDSKP